MQLSCIPVSFFSDIIEGKMSFRQWAELGKEAGLDAVDLSVMFFKDSSRQTLAAARSQVEDAGMQIAMLNTYPDMSHPDAAQRAKEIEAEIANVEMAAALGAKMVRVVAGQAHPETGRQEGIAWVTAGIKQVADATIDTGVQLVYENHGKPGAWQYTDFSQPPDIFLEIARGIADTSVGINYDSANATAFSDDPVALLEAVIDRVVSVHAADTGVKGQLTPVVVGEGIAPIEALFTVLHRAGWDRWMCIEEASFQGPEGLKKAARFCREAWESTRS